MHTSSIKTNIMTDTKVIDKASDDKKDIMMTFEEFVEHLNLSEKYKTNIKRFDEAGMYITEHRVHVKVSVVCNHNFQYYTVVADALIPKDSTIVRFYSTYSRQPEKEFTTDYIRFINIPKRNKDDTCSYNPFHYMISTVATIPNIIVGETYHVPLSSDKRLCLTFESNKLYGQYQDDFNSCTQKNDELRYNGLNSFQEKVAVHLVKKDICVKMINICKDEKKYYPVLRQAVIPAGAYLVVPVLDKNLQYTEYRTNLIKFLDIERHTEESVYHFNPFISDIISSKKIENIVAHCEYASELDLDTTHSVGIGIPIPANVKTLYASFVSAQQECDVQNETLKKIDNQ